MKNISLTSAMSMNLLSLKQTSSTMSEVQNRLATGLKVNSAIDNPSAYYTAVSLNNRASDLSVLLDTMSQGIQTIKAANEALETGTAVLQQAKAVAEKACESSVDIVAKVHNEAELLAAVEKGGAGYIIVESDINLTNQIQLKDGQKLVGDNYFAGNDGPNRKLSFDFTGKSGDAILAGNKSVVSNLDIDFIGDAHKECSGVVTARTANNVTFSNLNITLDHDNMDNIEGNIFCAILIDQNSDAVIEGKINIHTLKLRNMGIMAIGNSSLDISAEVNIKTEGVTSVGIQAGMKLSPNAEINIKNNSKINIEAVSHSGVVSTTDSLINITDCELNIIAKNTAVGTSSFGQLNISNSRLNLRGFYGLSSAHSVIVRNSLLNIESESRAPISISSSSTSASLTIDKNSRINMKNSQLYYLFILSNVSSDSNQNSLFIQKGAILNFYGNDAESSLYKFNQDYNFSTSEPKENIRPNNFDGYADKSAAEDFPDGAPDIPDIADKLSETFSGDVSLEETKPDNRTYSETLSQYDMLINDASYKGINLLQSNNLKINFNEERTSSIEVKGVDASAEGLGIHSLEWETQMDLLNSVEELENAINKLRSFSAEFGNYYSIVTTREDFTENLINVLTEGADKLILADMNEESANMLALQTSQQLAINSLSLASQAGQSVLRLFA